MGQRLHDLISELFYHTNTWDKDYMTRFQSFPYHTNTWDKDYMTRFQSFPYHTRHYSQNLVIRLPSFPLTTWHQCFLFFLLFFPLAAQDLSPKFHGHWLSPLTCRINVHC